MFMPALNVAKVQNCEHSTRREMEIDGIRRLSLSLDALRRLSRIPLSLNRSNNGVPQRITHAQMIACFGSSYIERIRFHKTRTRGNWRAAESGQFHFQGTVSQS